MSEKYEVKRKKPIPMAVSGDELFSYLSQMLKWRPPYPIYGVFAMFLYLTGARVSEGLAVRKMDITRESNGWVVNLKTLKSRIKTLRRIPIIDNSHDHAFFRIVNAFLEKNLDFFDEKERIFFEVKSRKLAWYRFSKVEIKTILLDPVRKEWIKGSIRLFPHYLRHCRLSHLVSHFGYREFDLVAFAGWSSVKPASFYVKLDYRDLKRKLIEPDVVTKYYEWVEKHGY